MIRNWLIGMRISVNNMDGTRSERYGEGIIEKLSEELTGKYGKGFDEIKNILRRKQTTA